MTALVTVAEDLQARAIASALADLAPNTRRAYGSRIDQWLQWANGAPMLDREGVKAYIRALELQGRSPQVRNQSLAALKRLASEAAALGWIDHQQAAQLNAIKAKRTMGVRTGRWLNAVQAAGLMKAPDRTITGKRDACVLALLLGCGLRRAEACSLETAQIRMYPSPDGTKVVITNLTGKGGRLRTVAAPKWAAQRIEDWMKELQKEGRHK